MAQEDKFAKGVMRIAATQQNGICTFKRAYAEMPNYVNLSAGNLALSMKRPGEPMWHQIVRNIKSHDSSYTNFIAAGLLVHIPRVGYRITDKGRRSLT